MKIVRNNIIPFKGYSYINLFGVLFTRKTSKIRARTLNHERIRTAQMKELLFVGFYFLYLLEWVLNGFCYDCISFEKEAYDNEKNFKYLSSRRKYSWVKYLKR